MRNHNSQQSILESVPPAKTQKATKWRIVTNQRNFFYMLSAGLIMSPKGFGGKYYLDTLSNFPGWIPLFADNVPKEAIDQSVRERPHLIPCIGTIDLKALRGRLTAVDIGGSTREIMFPDELNGSEIALLVPAPLPVTWVESIAFASKDEKSRCEVDVRDFGNVPLLDFKLDVNARLFAETRTLSWPPSGLTLPDRDYPLDKPLAAGGIMAMLLHMGNLGDLGMQASRLGFDPGATGSSLVASPMIGDIGVWLETGLISTPTDLLPKLFWGAVDSVTKCRSAVEAVSPIDVVLGYLESVGNDLEESDKQRLAKLAIDLRKLISFTDSTITELFERHPKPFSRVMTLFFLREKCADLLEFRHHLLSEVDYVGAAILFAAREGWLGLPLALRDIEGLQAAVSHRMAAMTHHLAGSEIDLGKPPARPVPLRELFVQGATGWTSKQREAALLFARESKWNECINTSINLGKGEYQIVIDGGGVQILIPGDVKAVVREVNPSQFFSLLSRTMISNKTDKKIRLSLKA